MSQQIPDTDGFGPRAKTHEEFAQPTVDDRELSSNNFGAGYYQNAEVYDQTQRFKQSINANAGIGEDIMQLALGETWQELGRSGWEVKADDNVHNYPPLDMASGEYADAAADVKSSTERRAQAEIRYGKQVFMTMPDHLKEFAVMELASIDEPFDPPEMRVSKFFHEATRSKGGRLMDNVFGRVRKRILEGVESTEKPGLFSRNGGNR